jgi:cytochrome c peroxidase
MLAFGLVALMAASQVMAAAPGGKKVLLGTPELTSGIPGEGKLTVAEIKAWLAKPENHEALDVELPFGLSVGKSAISIPSDNPLTRAKVELGRQLYFDTRLCADSTVSCASCHAPDQGYAANTPTGVGIGGQKGGRNSPVSYNRILSSLQFWDGRAGTLEAQAVGPIANPIEMGNTHEECVATLKKIEGYQLQFAAIFKDGVTIDNVGRALAAFERTLVTNPSPADYYEPLLAFESRFPDEVKDLKAFAEDDAENFARYKKLKDASDAHPISESAKRGRALFFGNKASCTACHVGANFTDEKFHNLGVGMDAAKPDLGRFDVTKDPKDKGAFKTPTIRNVALSPPYMHDGSQKTLEEVVEWYDKGGHPNANLSDKVKKLNLTKQEKADLVAYMKSLTGEFTKVRHDRLP